MKQIIIIVLFVFSSLLYSQDNFIPDEDLNYAQVNYVRLTEKANGTWTFDVTVRHNDTGWKHYTDLWIIEDVESQDILGKRVLAHPHVTEQPFTRSLSGVQISDTTKYLEIRSKCLVHGYLGKRVLIDMDKKSGENYEIIEYP